MPSQIMEMSSEEKKEYERLKKEAWRTKQHAKLNGTYEPTPLERAKKLLD